MTYAEALDLLELSPAEAADIQRVRAAYARRRQQLQNQLKATAAPPLRAAYQETLAAVDMAAAMLQTRAAPAGTAAPQPGNSRRPDWITATPWQDIDAEHPRSAEQGRGPTPDAPPVAHPASATPARRQAAATVRVPSALLESTPTVAELRTVPTTVGVVRPAQSPALFLSPTEEVPGHSRVAAYAALVLMIGGLAGAAGWAWNAGLFDRFLEPKAPQLSGSGAQGPPGTGKAATGENPEAALRELALRRRDIEQLATELAKVNETLGGAAVLDWREQLAAAQRAQDDGDLDDAAVRLARLYDLLTAQTEAATQVLTSRQRLRSTGAITGDSPIARAAAAHVQALERQAQVSIAESNYMVAAEKYDRALEARVRLPRDVDLIEAARAPAAEQQQRALDSLARLDLDEEARQQIIGDPADAEILAGSGAFVAGWLANERPASDLVGECEKLAASLRGAADRLEKVVELRALADASNQELERIEADLGADGHEPGQLARLLPEAGEAAARLRSAEAALAAGRMDEAIADYETATAVLSDQLEAAQGVRDLLLQRAEAIGRLEDAGASVRARFEDLDALLVQKAQASRQQDSPWHAAAARLTSDRAALLDLAASAPALPQESAALAAHVQQVALRAQAFDTLGKALESLLRAEYRTLLLLELAAGANVYIAADTHVPVAGAAGARAAVAEIARKPTLSDDDLTAAHRALTDLVSQTDAAADRLAAPAATTLAQMLRQSQEAYRQKFGGIDLASIWQPAEALADVKTPTELAGPVAEALAANLEEEALQRDLLAGDVAQAEAALRHVGNLSAAQETLLALRQAAEREDDAGMRQLHRSAAAGETEQVRSLLALRVEPAPRDSEGRTPLGLSLAEQHLEAAQVLLKSGGKPPAWLEGGQPIIFIAAASPEALKLLLENGAPARDLHRGETALHALAWQANRQQVPAARQLQAARILLDAGVDRLARNRSSQTASELAASLGLRELAEFLAKAPR